ncbi:hypothetical protein L1887_25325 [Cichorium endivia]|nr:hypothetical protein L1887_25325 [Cichorium endivia]
MKEFDYDGDTKVTIDEFTDKFTKWLDETKSAVNKPYRSVNSWKDLYQVIKFPTDDMAPCQLANKHNQPVKRWKPGNLLKMSKKVVWAFGFKLKKIVQPWVQTKKEEHEMMKVLVLEIISHSKNIPFGNFYKPDGKPNVSAIKRLFKSLDVNNDNSISLSKLKKLMMNVDFVQTSWNVDEATSHIMEDLDTSGDNQIDEKEFKKKWEKYGGVDDVDRSWWAWTKAVTLLVLGIDMLILLPEPLIHSIYDGVFMNNVLAFSVLLAIVYFRELIWHFAAELMTVFIVCLIVGTATGFRSKFPI